MRVLGFGQWERAANVSWIDRGQCHVTSTMSLTGGAEGVATLGGELATSVPGSLVCSSPSGALECSHPFCYDGSAAAVLESGWSLCYPRT